MALLAALIAFSFSSEWSWDCLVFYCWRHFISHGIDCLLMAETKWVKQRLLVKMTLYSPNTTDLLTLNTN
jgi:hypothetical protein